MTADAAPRRWARACLRRAAPAAGTAAWTLVGLAAAGLLALSVLPLFGGRLLIVTSGSMRPAIDAGDGAVILETPAEEITEGDVIAFQGYGRDGLTTHRVVSRHHVQGDLHFRTRGDANENPDPNLAPAAGVAGRVALRLPEAGWLLRWLSTTTGRLVTLVVPALLLAGLEARDLVRDRRRQARTRGGRDARPFWLSRVARRLGLQRGSTGVIAAVGLVSAGMLLMGTSPAGALMTDEVSISGGTITTLQVTAPTINSAEFSCGLPLLGVPGTEITWGEVTDADDYVVVRSTEQGGPYNSTVATVPDGTTTSATDTSFNYSTTYYYAVKTVRSGWVSDLSGELVVTTPLLCL